jgi:threonyl-tRNA synthetase
MAVAVRVRGATNKQVVMPVQDFVEKLKEEVHSRSLKPLI